jgi:hypothetical protein
MIWVILLKFIKNEWRYVTTILALIAVYYAVYDHGYDNCENRVKQAEEKSATLEKTRSGIALKSIMEEQQNENEKNKEIQNNLNNIIKKYNSMPNCNIDANSMRTINRLAK